ncbi:uncharacterized protein LOC108256814 [Ictalurus punctatus]|uniref:Uncharacterized protein LOC108256814 n=1 Tax=Ictalurus punctatus TaxID=7998 RepID=A0A9F7TFX9_ICTPU|nr:uncharacterized protein LOC108256814 [Ictalurus punctatus]
MPPPHNRVRLLIRDMMTVTQYQAILAVARNDFLKIFRKLVSSAQVLSTEETSYRRYCTALLVLRHFQCPAAVQGLTVSEWVNRKEVDDRVVIGFGRNETMQRAACFALTKEEEAWLQAYYSHIRPRVIRSDLNCDRFFLSSADTALLTVSNDLGVLHKAYEKSWSMGTLENFLRATSRQARGALETAAANLTDTEKEAVSSYLAYNTAVAKLRRVPTPQTVVATATLLDSLAGSDTDRFSGPSGTKSLDFAAFLMRFPASADSKAPTKLDRLKTGFPGDRVFYDKWRAAQKAKRMERLLKAFTRKPQESRVKYGILKEGWKNNCPKPADVLAAWKPATQFVIETDEDLRRNVSQQTWKGLAIKDFGGEKGLAVVATQPFSRVTSCVITMGRTGQRPLCIDAQTFPCECHPCADTVGRRLNHSSKQANLCPEPFVLKVNGQDVDVVLFRALRDISVDIELKFDYGVKRKSFRGEDQDLQWLDE